jgi:PAS domain S-box-containing protein
MTETRPDLQPDVPSAILDTRRLSALRSLEPGKPRLSEEFREIVEIAAGLFSAPIALLTLIDERREWIVARIGTDIAEIDAYQCFGAHAIAVSPPAPFVVRDASRDPRFLAQPCVTNGARFYVGAPLLVEGQAVGMVCVIDNVARTEVPDALLAQLQRLARLASRLMTFKEESRVRAARAEVLSRDEKRHAQALEAANVGSWFWDAATGLVTCNAAMARMFGVTTTSISARDIIGFIHPDDRPAMLENLRKAMVEDAEYASTFRVETTGRWVLGRGRVHERDAAGRPKSFLGVNIDVTAEQSTTQRTRLLLRELNHRVKNTLAMLQSLARQTLRQTSDPQEFMTAFAGRLQAISEAHGLLSDHEWGEIRLAALLKKQLSPHVRDYEAQVEIHKDEILLGPDQAVGLGLVLHELATNAFKYGALSVPNGRIVITARGHQEETGRVLNLTWTEVGGPPVHEPTRRGFGSILIERSLDKVMGSSVKVEYLPAGVTAIVRLPL